MPNIAIPAPREPFLDPETGLVSRSWYLYLFNLYGYVNGPTNDELRLLATASQSGVYDQLTLENTQEFRLAPISQYGTMALLQQDNVPYIRFSPTPSPDPATFTNVPVGTVWWDGGTTLNAQMTANVTQKVGESQFFYVKASSSITKGQLAMFTGAVGASGVITVAPSSGVTDGQYLVGVAAEDIALNAFGLVQNFGVLKGINTNAFNEGDVLYYDPTTPGGLTNVLPTAPNVKATIAAVINKSVGNGQIIIRMSTGSVLGGTDSNVQFGTLASGNVIIYNAAAGYWQNAFLTAGTGISITNGAGAVTISSTASGTVTSVNVSGGTTGLTFSGGPITSSGTITMAGTLAAANGGTGVTSLGTGVATWLQTPSSANLAAAVTGETGSGALVFGTAPTIDDLTIGSGTAGNVYYGTFTPSLTNVTNIAASTASAGQYMRVGNTVTFSGQVNIDPTAAGYTVLRMTIPVASNFSASRNAAGTFSSLSTTQADGGGILADTVGDQLEFRYIAVGTANTAFSFHATYLVQ